MQSGAPTLPMFSLQDVDHKGSAQAPGGVF